MYLIKFLIQVKKTYIMTNYIIKNNNNNNDDDEHENDLEA